MTKCQYFCCGTLFVKCSAVLMSLRVADGLGKKSIKTEQYDQTISRQSRNRAEGGRDQDSVGTLYS